MSAHPGLAPRVGRENAHRELRPRRPRWLFRLLRARKRSWPHVVDRSLLRMELVWLPAHYLQLEVRRGEDRGTIYCLVDGFDGAFDIIKEPITAWRYLAAGDIYRPSIDATKAEEIARTGLARVARRASIGETLGTELIHRPYWAYYYERRRGLLDVRLVDAISGGIAGPKTKVALLAALESRANQSTVGAVAPQFFQKPR